MYDKMEAVRRTAQEAASQLGLEDEAKTLDRAAYLCKADLTTELVRELPNLQGVMGGIYARCSGESDEVANAIVEHYHPRFAGDDLPVSPVGRALALSDKFSTLAVLVAVAGVSSGSTDPYGLRREASGVVRIAVEIGRPGSVRRLVERALGRLAQQAPTAVDQVMDFLRQRLETHLRQEAGIRYDLVQAALAVGADDIRLASARAHALDLLSAHEDFLPTVIATTRVSNIVKGFEGGEPDPALFREEAETGLWQAYQQALREAETANLMELFGLFGRLREPINRYFDEVLVMHEDEKIRRNRLAMCWQINQLFRRLADFTLIVQV